jgi:outer membrane receptor for ferrienterochelin and colicin
MRLALVSQLLLLLAVSAFAQLQQGAITGVVTAPDGRPADSATITLLDPLGVPLSTATVSGGAFTLSNVPLGTYAVRADAPQLQAFLPRVAVTSAIPVKIEMRLSAVAAEQVVVQGEDATAVSPMTRVTLGGESVRRAPARLRSRGLQDAIATAGWSTEDNGLLHSRGVDDGFLYVIDGIPVYERLDGLFGTAPDPAMVDSLNIVTGYVPAEFGWKAGGVLEVRSAARTADRWSGSFEGSVGNDRTRQFSAVSGGPVSLTSSLTVGLSRQASSRYLDPVHPDNLHNDGNAWSGGGQFSWAASDRDTVTAVAGFSRSAFDVPHAEEQDAAGQDQTQRIGQYSQHVSWQRAWSPSTVSQLAAYNRHGSSVLNGSEHDTPLFTHAERTLGRIGVLASVSHQRGRHLIKGGGEVSWLRLDEDFLFGVTDEDLGEEAGLSDEALEYTIDDPFHFTGTERPSLAALFLQDTMRLSNAVTFDAGVRVDWSQVGTSASQVSPRIGAAYRLDAWKTTVRASAGRFFQPPQAENLLLSSSEQAWSLSPFATETGGGAELAPERQTAVEVGFEHVIARHLRLDVAWWRRWISDVADPNVFFGTTILFPNSVAEGRASGLDVRLEVPRRRGWSGYLSYANGRVVQYGPISGGLFLEDEVIEIGPGTGFTPDHDQRNVGAFGVSYDADAPGLSVSISGRHESGTPLEVDDDELDELAERPGAELVDFERGRVEPRTLFDIALSQRLLKRGSTELTLRLSVGNVTGQRFAFNFGNPFSGTHFGPGRTVQVGGRVVF